ncbi:DUF4365 domain-containing protein [Glutamicibacter sp. 2E12]|uniref:DUF4365 domain-containing protein n=1 Tax=Glutamicibacter sp. 2E12 TaxID=3416181 RepID=UPI003CEB309A
MAMRAGKTERIGTSGQSKVKAKFEDLEWGANPNDDHDLGTDLWLQARDERRFDLGALVGAQVKSSDDASCSYFSRPSAAGEVDGWWYSESDQDHFKYWTEHAVPHILVLHNHDSEISYWVHVTKDAVVDTGKGAKILVPASQTLDAAHRDQLVAVATSRRTGTTWAGSVWSSQNKIFREDRLRYAAIAPRLVAPHPNAMPKTLEPEQALALLTQMRLRDLDSTHNSDRQYLPVEEASISDNWRWRLYAALYKYVNTADPQSFDSVTASASTAEERVASSAMQAASFMESGRCQEAQRVLIEALAYDDASPADNAWLKVQLARCLRDMGDAIGAQRIALDIQQLRQSAPEDPTVIAVCGVAANIIFSTSPMGNGNFGETVIGRDTPPAWWRTQVLATGLNDHFAGDFKTWANDESVTWGKSDTAWLSLRAVSLMSGFAGDHPNWRHSLSLLAQRQLMTCGDASIKPVTVALHDLRWSGDKKALDQATRRVVWDGPAIAAQQVGREIDLSCSTRTSIQNDISFLIRAADVLDASTADRAVKWALQTITDPRPFIERYQPMFTVWHDALKLLAAAVPAASIGFRRKAIDHVLALPIQADQHRALLFARVLNAIGQSTWTSADTAKLRSRAAGDHHEFKVTIDSLLAEQDESVRERLVEEVRSGSLQALDSIPDLRILDTEAARSVIVVLRYELTQQQDAARGGAYGFGGRDLGRTLFLLNVWHPEAADWEPVIELLTEPSTAADHLRGALSVFPWMPERIPSPVVERIVPLLRERMTHVSEGDLSDGSDIRGLAADALNAIRPGALTKEELWSLMGGTRDQRSSAVFVIARRKNPADINLLASFACDKDADVRSAVASSLAGWVREGVSTQESEQLLVKLLQEPGIRLARNVSSTLAGVQPDALSEYSNVVALLQSHISAAVRSTVRAAAE